MPKRKPKLQKRIDRLTREKYALLRTIEQLLRDRNDELDPALNEIRQGKRSALRIIKKEH